MLQKFYSYRFIILISVIGFLITGLLAIPFYMYWGDSEYTFNKFSIEHFPPTNWMGWFYVYFWDTLYRITGAKASIGVFHNLAYWISMPILYINFFEQDNIKQDKFFTSYQLWYLLLVLNPIIIGFFFGITNNVFVASFLLITLALYSGYFKTGYRLWLWFALIFCLIMIFIRRDTLILVIPMLAYTSYILMNKKIIQSILLTVFMLTIQQTIDETITNQIPYYNEYQAEQISIDTEGIVIAYDLFTMGYYKKEVLFPEFVLSEKYHGTNRAILKDRILGLNPYDAIFNWGVLQDFGWDIYKTGTVWYSGLKIRDTWKIYLENFHWYLWVKLNMFYAYSLYLWPQLILSIVAMIILFMKKTSSVFAGEKKNFMLMLILAAWIFSGAVILSVNSIQARYLIPSNILLWMTSLYVIRRFAMLYKIEITKK